MAQRGRPIPPYVHRAIVSLADKLSVRRAARQVGVSPTTVQKYFSLRRLQFGTAAR